MHTSVYDFDTGWDDLWPTQAHFTTCDWIKGGTLERTKPIQVNQTTKQFLVLQLSLHMPENDCDGCIRKHSSNNTHCSFTQHIPSPLQPGKLYDFQTKKHIKGNWQLDQNESQWRDTIVGIETWQLQ